MKIAYYSEVLNHHQAALADEFYKLLGDKYVFVELKNSSEHKGSTVDFSKRPYLLKAWESRANRDQAFHIASTAEVCVFSGVLSFPFEKNRLRKNLLSFDMDERPLKRGLINVFSPANLRMLYYYWLYRWYRKPLYKLCCSAFTKSDYKRLFMFKDKCFKWGYFTYVDPDFDVEASRVTCANGR